MIVNVLCNYLQIRLVVIDSITFHFRMHFADMSVRTRLLHTMAQCLMSVAESNNAAVVLMNQVTTKVGEEGGTLVPALGESWGHACTNRYSECLDIYSTSSADFICLELSFIGKVRVGGHSFINHLPKDQTQVCFKVKFIFPARLLMFFPPPSFFFISLLCQSLTKLLRKGFAPSRL